MATTKAKTTAAKAKAATNDSTTSEVKEPVDATSQESTAPETSAPQVQEQGGTKPPEDPEPEPQVQLNQESTPPAVEANGKTQVKLKMPLWDSLKQQSFTIGDLYPCSEKEAQRLIDNGTAVKADA
ncbi:TPA: hypothetical protein ACOLZV_002281 [Vibrio parahaemolyticus]